MTGLTTKVRNPKAARIIEVPIGFMVTRGKKKRGQIFSTRKQAEDFLKGKKRRKKK